jgi:hypothetical protein
MNRLIVASLVLNFIRRLFVNERYEKDLKHVVQVEKKRRLFSKISQGKMAAFQARLYFSSSLSTTQPPLLQKKSAGASFPRLSGPT